jgi:hypothetical protein
MHVTCPCCNESFPIVAGLLEPDGKRFGMLLAGMEPALGRATIEYLALFTPPKQKLRLAKAVKLVAMLDTWVREGSVCRDERGGVRRPASISHWVAGIEQMLEQRAKLTLPLLNHHYLRAIVYGLADQADAAGERKSEEARRNGSGRKVGPSPTAEPEDPLTQQLRYLDQMREYGRLTEEEWDAERVKAFEKYRGVPA